MTQFDHEELGLPAKDYNGLVVKTALEELGPKQGFLDLGIERQTEVDGIGMGVLKDGTAFLTGRGLARLVGIENLHIRTIGQEWNDPKPRTEEIKRLLAKRGAVPPSAYIETTDGSRAIHAFPEAVCLAVLEYYAFDAARPREVARDNYRLLAGKALRDLIYSQVGYDPTGAQNKRFDKWHDRIALNYQSAPRGFFHVFNEAHTIVYEMIVAGAPVGEKVVVDISIGQHWSKFWTDNGMGETYGDRAKYPHCYPDSHPQSKANPHESWCYPLSALGDYRAWLQDVYIEGGKFSSYLKMKVAKGELAPSVAQLAISALAPVSLPN